MKTLMLLMMLADSAPAGTPEIQLLDFTASYCQPCKDMLPALQRMEQDGFPIRRIDITEEHELARLHRVDRVPTMVLMVQGREAKRFVGLTDERELRSEMNRAARKLSDSRSSGDAATVVLLDFTAEYCEPCKQMKPVLQRLEDEFIVRRVDIEQDRELAQRYGVDRIPTLIVLSGDQEVRRFVGLTSEEELRGELRAAKSRIVASAATAQPAKAEPSAGNDQDKNATAGVEGRSIGGIFNRLLGRTSRGGDFEYPSFRAQSPDPSASAADGLAAAEAATVRIKVIGKSSKDGTKVQDVGTGTIVYSARGQALILTCAHVFLDISIPDAVVEVEVFQNGTPTSYPAKVVGGDHNSDLAILKIQTSKLLPHIQLTADSPTLSPAQDLVSFGCNNGANPTRLETKLVEVNRYNGPANLVCTSDPAGGRSGGGLFSRSGELLAVCSCADRKRSEGLYMAHAAIMELVNRLKLSSTLISRSSAGGGDDAAEVFDELTLEDRSPAAPTGSGREVAATGVDEKSQSGQLTESDETSTGGFADDAGQVAATDDAASGVRTADVSGAAVQPAMTAAAATQGSPVDNTQTPASGPEVTILIDDKSPGSEKKVIVIPRASPWLMEILTGESSGGEAATAALRPQFPDSVAAAGRVAASPRRMNATSRAAGRLAQAP